MKRIMTTVVALAAVLGISTAANAVSYNYDISGAAGSVVTVSSFASTPCTGYPVSAFCFTNPLSAGSSLDLDITGGVATIINGTANIDTVTPLFGGIITITTDVVGTISGGTGTLVGDDILWTAPAAYSALGTLVCTDLGLSTNCGTLGLVAGTIYPISVLNTLGNTSTVSALDLGIWDLSADLSTINGTTRAVTSTSNVAPNLPAGWLYLGADNGFYAAPEPGSLALVLLGLGGLALRARKA